MTFEKLKEEINKRSKDAEIIFEADDELIVNNRYKEYLNFYSNGKVKCYNHCRFLLDELGYNSNCNDATLEAIGFDGLIRQWNKEEKCGYWRVPKNA